MNIRWIKSHLYNLYIIILYLPFHPFTSTVGAQKSPRPSVKKKMESFGIFARYWVMPSLEILKIFEDSFEYFERFWKYFSNHPRIQATDLEDLFSLIDEAPFESVWSFPLRLFQQSFCAAPFLPVTAFRRFDLETCLKCCRDMQDTVSSDWIWSWCINSVVMIWAGAFLFYSCSVLNTVSLRSLNV